MKIAIPTLQGNLCAHFGHCEAFFIFEVNQESKEILKKEELTPPPHEPGILPQWLKANEVSMVIAGGMGRRAQDLFARYGIESIVGVSPAKAEEVVMNYLNTELAAGENLCDH